MEKGASGNSLVPHFRRSLPLIPPASQDARLRSRDRPLLELAPGNSVLLSLQAIQFCLRWQERGAIARTRCDCVSTTPL